MPRVADGQLAEIIELFGLEALERPADLERLAKDWGVTSIEIEPIASDAMLLPSANGYKVVLKEATHRAHFARHRFSFAHELGHLLLNLSGLQPPRNQPRDPGLQSQEERLCDRIASEILMPRIAFQRDGALAGWSLCSLTSLASAYHTSISATAIRMVDLMPRQCLLGVWKVPSGQAAALKLQWSHSQAFRYGVPGLVPRDKLELVVRAACTREMQSGLAPIVDKDHQAVTPPQVSAEALAWGQGEYKQVMVFYYPEQRRPSLTRP